MKGFSEVMSGPTPMSPSTSPAGVVSSTGALDAGTTPVFSMSGPEGPPVTYRPTGAIGATGPGVDPLQGSGDPWGHGQQQNPSLSFAPVSSASVFPGAGLLDFMSVAAPPPLLLLLLLAFCRSSTTTIHAQCSLPDLNHDQPRPAFVAGPQPRPATPSDQLKLQHLQLWLSVLHDAGTESELFPPRSQKLKGGRGWGVLVRVQFLYMAQYR